MNWRIINECITTILLMLVTISCLWLTFLVTDLLLNRPKPIQCDKKYEDNVCFQCIENESKPWEIHGEYVEE